MTATSVDPTAASAAAPPFTFAEAVIWGTTWSLNDFSPTLPSIVNDFTLLPLAIVQPPRFGVYVPEIASSWKTTSSTVTIHLRKNAKWQNGSAVTSKDLVDTVLLQGTNGNTVWDQISGVRAVGAHTVVFHLLPGAPSALALENILALYPLPSSVYGQFVTPGLQQNLVSYFAASQKNPKAAASSPAGKAVSAVFTKMVAFSPKTFLGDGPFQLEHITTIQATMNRSPEFWGAKKIHVPVFNFLNEANNNANYAVLLSGRADLLESGISLQIVQKWLKLSHANYITANNYLESGIYFNNAKYPLNITKVRQALAYYINRPDAATFANGGKAPYNLQLSATAYPDGIFPTVARLYMTPKQLHSLNPYTFNPAKAASLLDGLGFKRTNGRWVTPKGKPFNLSIGAPTCCSIIEEDMTHIASQLSGFGIKTSVDELDTATWATYEHEGRFALDWGWDSGGLLDPLQEAAYVLGPTFNFSSSGSYKGEDGIGFGPMASVPGLGKINVPSTLVKEETTTPQGPQWNALTYDWARLINRELPFLSLAYKHIQYAYSTARYGDWPSKKNPLWNILGVNQNGGIMVLMEKGFIRPKA